jgi:hypothetical protein
MAQAIERAGAEAEALIARHVEPHPARPGRGEWRLKERSVPVWALIGSIVLNENPVEHPEVLDDDRVAMAFSDAGLVARVTNDYGLSQAAMEAAITYYWHNKRQIDARLILNAA